MKEIETRALKGTAIPFCFYTGLSDIKYASSVYQRRGNYGREPASFSEQCTQGISLSTERTSPLNSLPALTRFNNFAS